MVADPVQDRDQAFLLDVYARVAFIRAFEAQALELSRSNPPAVMGSIHLCAGQEVPPVATLAALTSEDQVICTYRGHGWALAAGVDPLAVMAEICHRDGGLNGGRGGSAYMMAPQTRFIGENSIVGAGTTIACGVALANVHFASDRIVVVSIGDGAMNQGSVHEAMAYAATRKFPVIFIIENNGWSEMTATSDMFRVDRLASRARGYGIPSATLSGTDPRAVLHSVRLAAEHARAGKGPSVLEMKVPRLWGHYNRDIEHYRSKADRVEAEKADPLSTIADDLRTLGISSERLRSIVEKENREAAAIVQQALDLPLASEDGATQHVVRAPIAPQMRIIETRTMSYSEAINLALRTELEQDDRVVVFGEDVGKAGGIFGVARRLQKQFGDHRVFDTPIAENAILGSALGAALCGMKPVAEIMWADFVFVAIDQLINQAANIRYVTRGKASAPLVVRMQQGATPGSCPQHSQSIEAMLAHVPGLKVGLVATANDAYAMLRAAIADPDPCIIIESRALYQTQSNVDLTDKAEAVGGARKHRDGADVGIITWGAMLHKALEAADMLQAEGIDAAVLDLRWLSPLDDRALVALGDEVNGNVVVAHEAVRTGGFGAEIALRLIEDRKARGLEHNVVRVATPDVRIPAAPHLQAALLPSAQRIAAAARQLAR